MQVSSSSGLLSSTLQDPARVQQGRAGRDARMPALACWALYAQGTMNMQRLLGGGQNPLLPPTAWEENTTLRYWFPHATC